MCKSGNQRCSRYVHAWSQRRQYDLRERAISLGFQSVVVIDEDLGRSGTGSVERPGFG